MNEGGRNLAKQYLRVCTYVLAGLYLCILLLVPEHYEWLVATWLGFVLETLILFALLIRWFWPQRRLIKFWFLLFTVLILHLSCWALVIKNFSHIPGLWEALALVLEGAGLWIALSLMLRLPLDRIDDSL